MAETVTVAQGEQLIKAAFAAPWVRMPPSDWYVIQVLLCGMMACHPDHNSPERNCLEHHLASAVAHNPPPGVRLIGDISMANAGQCFVALGEFESEANLSLRHALQQYNCTQGRFRGFVLHNSYFVCTLTENVTRDLDELNQVLHPVRVRFLGSWVKRHQVPTLPERLVPSLRALSNVVMPFLLAQFNREVSATGGGTAMPTQIPLTLLGRSKVPVGKNARGTILWFRIAPKFPKLPSSAVVSDILKTLGIQSNGFQIGRAPEVHPEFARFVFNPLADAQVCPLCCVKHKRCHNNFPYVQWKPSTQRLVLKCFDPRAKDENWFWNL